MFLSTPNHKQELKIGTIWEYARLVDTNIMKYIDSELEGNMTDTVKGENINHLLRKIIAMDVASYLMYHIGGDRAFDQSTSEILMSESSKLKEEYLKEYGSKYINMNIW